MQSEDQGNRKKQKKKNHTRDKHSYFWIVALSHINNFCGFWALYDPILTITYLGVSAGSRGWNDKTKSILL